VDEYVPEIATLPEVEYLTTEIPCWPDDSRSQRYLALQLMASTRDLFVNGAKSWMLLADDVIAYIESGAIPGWEKQP
jgi:hypothetical protein